MTKNTPLPLLTITASIPSVSAPSWAVWQRKLIETMSHAVYPFLAKYTREDSTLIWREYHEDSYQSRDGADDFYESFYNWALLYLLGGDDHLLALAHRAWDAVTQQLTELGLVHKEYERGYDQFHQGESYIYFYFLCLADPTHPKLIERARRFAGFYLNEDPEAQNYDPDHKIIRAPHNGSVGPRWGYFDGEISYGWYPYMAPYGLPYQDVEGVTSYDDLKDPSLARRMGEVMEARMGKGDVATNLIVTSLVANTYLLTSEPKYRQWLLEYVDAWRERARQNGGLLPDNVGLSGQVGEYINGKWYGGLYGWSWPHGYYNIGMAALVAGANAYLLTGNPDYLDLPRTQIDTIHQLGKTHTLGSLATSLGHHWIGMLHEHTPETEVFVVPYRYQDSGWFDYQTPTPIYPVALWNLTFQADDWARIDHLRKTSLDDWRQVLPFRSKEDAGHEQPWLCFLKGENRTYPEAILSESYFKVARRLEMIRQDDSDLTQVSIHHWQELNPVTTEALIQLTLGAPQIIYNGGLLMCQVRYFDVQRQRPGLPEDVGALVEKIEADHIIVHLVNLSVFEARDVIIQAGAFGEHQFVSATYAQRISDYPGVHGPAGYAAPKLETTDQTVTVNDHLLRLQLPPATEIRLRLEVRRFVNTPSYCLPWERLT
ncbi:MAG: hypothetical protein H7Y11_07060 [Armatimonadetes bacterium]|nr:hypothetical protein [Anaerolineae bacterium]